MFTLLNSYWHSGFFTTINDKATLQDQTNISLQKGMSEDGFPFPKVGYVSSLEGT